MGVFTHISEEELSFFLNDYNLKNVELISASNLNTLSLIKATQILTTPAALNEIKEIYCG